MNASELFTMDIGGRSGRLAFLVSLSISLLFIAIAVIISNTFDLQHLHLSKICVFGFGLWTTIIEIRRLHDINKSGWWSLILATPLNSLLIIALLVVPGTKGPNQFGK